MLRFLPHASRTLPQRPSSSSDASNPLGGTADEWITWKWPFHYEECKYSFFTSWIYKGVIQDEVDNPYPETRRVSFIKL